MGGDARAAAEALFPDEGPASKAGRGASAARVLAGLLERVELFHASDDRAYAALDLNGHRETHPVRSKRFRGWLGATFWAMSNRPVPGTAMAETLALAEARALAGPMREVHLRVAEANGRIYYDLGDPAWRAVEVDATGWRVLDRPAVHFRRAPGMLALPVPVPGGHVDEMRPLLNLDDDGAWRLLVAWLVGALAPRGPYPVLVLGGEHGSAKSWTANRLRDLVDPNEAPNRAEPREPRDLVIAARNGWVLGFDNVSDLAPWLSDGLCRLATGSGFATRELYSDDSEVIFAATRAVILNGIGEVVSRPDLLDRSLLLTLPVIPEERRRDERDLLSAFAGVRPRVLGALLTAASAALRHRDDVRMARTPRLADFARWVTAAEPGLGWPRDTFLSVYDTNRSEAHELALEASPVAPVIRALTAELGRWVGTASELLAELSERAGEKATRSRQWPRSARALAGDLRRLAPNLRAVGVAVEFTRTTDSGRRRCIEVRESSVRTVHPVHPEEPSSDGSDDSDDEIPTPTADVVSI